MKEVNKRKKNEEEKKETKKKNKKKTHRDTVPGKRRRGRQQIRWKDSCSRDMEKMGLKVTIKMDDVTDRNKFMREIPNYSES